MFILKKSNKDSIVAAPNTHISEGSLLQHKSIAENQLEKQVNKLSKNTTLKRNKTMCKLVGNSSADRCQHRPFCILNIYPCEHQNVEASYVPKTYLVYFTL